MRLPLYHDMGLLLGAVMPITAGVPTVGRPVGSFGGRLDGSAAGTYVSAGPNFAFRVAVRKTSDDDIWTDLTSPGVHPQRQRAKNMATSGAVAEQFRPLQFCRRGTAYAYGMAERQVQSP